VHAGYLRLQRHTQNLILTAFPRQQWLNKRASILHYTHTACLVVYLFFTSEERKLERLCVYERTKWIFVVEVDRRGWGQFMCDSDFISNPKSSSLSPYRWEGAVYLVRTGEAGLGLGYFKYMKNGSSCCCWTSHNAWNLIRNGFLSVTFRISLQTIK